MPSSEGVLEVKDSVSECGTPSRRFRTIIEVCQKLLHRVADMPIARSVAREWQTDGYLKPGKIVSVRRLTTEEFLSGVMGWR